METTNFQITSDKCPYVCNLKNSIGYCKVTACINPKYNGSGTIVEKTEYNMENLWRGQRIKDINIWKE